MVLLESAKVTSVTEHLHKCLLEGLHRDLFSPQMCPRLDLAVTLREFTSSTSSRFIKFFLLLVVLLQLQLQFQLQLQLRA